MRTKILAAVFGFAVAFLMGFSTATAPPRHPNFNGLVTNTNYILMHDQYVNGSGSGIPNVTPKSVSCGQTQSIGIYDDGGSVGVNCIDSFNGTVTAVSTTPSAPSVNQTTAYAFQFDAGMPVMPFNIDNYFGVPSQQGLYGLFQFYSTTVKWFQFCAYPGGWGQPAAFSYNKTAAPQTVGSASSPAWSASSLATRLKIARYQSTTGANSSAGSKANASFQDMWRGNAAGAGGFVWWARWSPSTIAANSRTFVGLMNGTAFPLASSDPNAVLDSVYVGCNVGDSNLSICSNDNSGTATCSTLGASYPCTTSGAFYDLWLTAPPNAAYINFYLERLDSAANVAGTLTTDLPRNTVQLNGTVWVNTGSDSAAVIVDWYGTCHVANL